jgi:hypothetical protein
MAGLVCRPGGREDMTQLETKGRSLATQLDVKERSL